MSVADVPTIPAPSARRLHLVPADLRRPSPSVNAGLPVTVRENLGVPTVHRTVVDLADFDHGATTPALRSVQETVEAVHRTYGSVHRGAGRTSRLTTAWFEQARTEVGEFVGAGADDEVVFTRNTTDALNLLAHCLPADASVIAWNSAHHAALLPWPAERTQTLRVPRSADDAVILLTRALSQTPSGNTLVVLTGACNVTGEVWPIEELASVARQFGARTVLDAAQLAPHRGVNLQQLGVDWVAFSGHKAYAPYGAGALVGRSDWLDAAPPYLPAGGATRIVGAQDVDWNVGPARHEGGTPNAVGAIALASACSALRRHRATIEATEHALYSRLREGLAGIDGVNIVQVLGADRPNVGVVSFTVDGVDPSLVSQVLADEYGIAVRDGKFCAHRLCDEVVGGSAIRASLGLATAPHHVDRLVSGVRKLVEQGPTLRYYRAADGTWVAEGDPRDLTEPRPW
ncbi:aminotransferase class V-fold PLP-dependent enzyme [Yimella sp. cx-51]|uniref:aminotransferase class V-fold PLP-dependent enzyme n=1 Tax=Yimella sp. cx-51 TaxID=2770551 RepID=UPI00165E4C4F|nr:aminotransferase class V-fold PLP-dependent enzyme [Yimella sp. cx-51]MBC9957192.1 aminotransferase class V-fold PLP-dependent enzyme [Yimella sp. cx-51]QTH37158.1 aminotransferase class V-fold PLP-dependent enzyme [Yimella sp. cx-51]